MNDKKARLIALWEKHTQQPYSSEADFFESGGDSLSAINLIVDVQAECGGDISLEQFMRSPSLNFLESAVQ